MALAACGPGDDGPGASAAALTPVPSPEEKVDSGRVGQDAGDGGSDPDAADAGEDDGGDGDADGDADGADAGTDAGDAADAGTDAGDAADAADAEGDDAEDCGNGVDDDGDGWLDCADADCFADPICEEPGRCDDGVDNDLDGATDCADADCEGDPVCDESCVDLVDNDVDGLTDCEDPDCADDPACDQAQGCGDVGGRACHDVCTMGAAQDAACGACQAIVCAADALCCTAVWDHVCVREVTALCGIHVCGLGDRLFDGADDDGDGLADCADAEWREQIVCGGLGEQNCADDLDDDHDLWVDCHDADCRYAPACIDAELGCGDGLDQDGDLAVDCADSDCRAAAACGGTELACEDGEDDDGDGATDCADPDCGDAPPCAPAVPPSSGDPCALPNAVGCTMPSSDPGRGLPALGAEVTAERCADAYDNDGDDLTDCEDPGCWSLCDAHPPIATDDACAGLDCGPPPRRREHCADCVDNDGDGLVDDADPDCIPETFFFDDLEDSAAADYRDCPWGDEGCAGKGGPYPPPIDPPFLGHFDVAPPPRPVSERANTTTEVVLKSLVGDIRGTIRYDARGFLATVRYTLGGKEYSREIERNETTGEITRVVIVSPEAGGRYRFDLRRDGAGWSTLVDELERPPGGKLGIRWFGNVPSVTFDGDIVDQLDGSVAFLTSHQAVYQTWLPDGSRRFDPPWQTATILVDAADRLVHMSTTTGLHMEISYDPAHAELLELVPPNSDALKPTRIIFRIDGKAIKTWRLTYQLWRETEAWIEDQSRTLHRGIARVRDSARMHFYPSGMSFIDTFAGGPLARIDFDSLLELRTHELDGDVVILDKKSGVRRIERPRQVVVKFNYRGAGIDLKWDRVEVDYDERGRIVRTEVVLLGFRSTVKEREGDSDRWKVSIDGGEARTWAKEGVPYQIQVDLLKDRLVEVYWHPSWVTPARPQPKPLFDEFVFHRARWVTFQPNDRDNDAFLLEKRAEARMEAFLSLGQFEVLWMSTFRGMVGQLDADVKLRRKRLTDLRSRRQADTPIYLLLDKWIAKRESNLKSIKDDLAALDRGEIAALEYRKNEARLQRALGDPTPAEVTDKDFHPLASIDADLVSYGKEGPALPELIKAYWLGVTARLDFIWSSIKEHPFATVAMVGVVLAFPKLAVAAIVLAGVTMTVELTMATYAIATGVQNQDAGVILRGAELLGNATVDGLPLLLLRRAARKVKPGTVVPEAAEMAPLLRPTFAGSTVIALRPIRVLRPPVTDVAELAPGLHEAVNVRVGRALGTEREAMAVLRALAAGDRKALQAVGMGELGFAPNTVEWGVAHQRWARGGEYWIVKGWRRFVDWGELLHHSFRPVAHAHPERLLPGTTGAADSVPLARLLEHGGSEIFLMSGSDVAFAALHGPHRVVVPYRYLGGPTQLIGNLGTTGEILTWQIDQIQLVAHHGVRPVYQATARLTTESGTVLWEGLVRGCAHPNGSSWIVIVP